MALQAGVRLGPYQILAPIGAGGMGEVYKARDTKLNRDVAIKVLPEVLAKDPAALARFEREAQAVAALSHSNILAIHDFGSDAGVSYAVTELLDGETLRARMDMGPMPVRKAVEYGVQIVRGLAAAHQKGIVHRDLKPENIFLTKDGHVKILDFGLAKAAGTTTTPGETQLAGTEPGTVMGTVGYMSPEQVRGLAVDQRTDIFSFGAVFYEMLSGRRAFKGDSSVETMNAILKEDPPEFVEIASGVPTALDRIVRRCLEKQPDERFHSAHDLGLALETVSTSSSASSASLGLPAMATSKGRRPSVAMVGAVGAVVATALVAAAYVAGRQLGTAGATAPEFARLTFRRGPIFSAKLAPDGNTIVYSAAWDGTRELFSTRPGSPESLQLPFAHADVESISSSGELAIIMNRRFLNAYSQVGTLARAPLSGGASRAILEDVQDADWLPDGSTLAVSRFTNGRYQLEFPVGKVVYSTGGWISHLRVSPDGQMVAFLDHPIFGDDRGSAAVVDRAGTKRTLTGEYESTQGLAWLPSGQEIWFTGAERGSARALLAVTLSAVVRIVDRTPGTLTLGDIGKDGAVLLVQDNGRRGIIGLGAGETHERDLSWLDWSQPLALTDDGKTLLISEQGDGGGPGYSVYLRKTDGSPAVRLGGGDAQGLSPDGQWVLALRLNPAPAQLILLPTGAGDAKVVTNDAITHLAGRFLPDGKRIVFVGFATGRQPRIYIQDLEGGTAKPVTPEGVASSVAVSPDGREIVAQRKLYPIAGGDPRPITGLDPLDSIVRWTTDGRGLYVRRTLDTRAVEVARFDLATGKRTPIRQITPLPEAAGMGGIGQLLITPEASGYVYGYGITMSDLYLVKGLR
jgi:tRNA A-37 threonylcarbamoyl transferase component Bud32/dipeptidyl aminopeptidase/acylaminoacyl peptidase